MSDDKLQDDDDLPLEQELVDQADDPVAPATEEPVEPPADEDDDVDVDGDADRLPEGAEDAPVGPSATANNPHVHMRDADKDACTKPFKPAQKAAHERGELMYLLVPAGTREELDAVVESLPDASTMSDEARQWAQVMVGGYTHMVREGDFPNTLNRGRWVQAPEHNGARINLAMPRTKDIPEGTILSGNDAILHMARTAGLYGKIQIPLMHTGIWIDIDVPTDGDLYMFEQLLADREFSLGYLSKGLAYSNTMVNVNIELANFVLDRVTAATVKDISKGYLMSIIRVQDLQIMAWALATAAFPTGFPYGRACIANPLKCNHVEREVLRLAKLLWTDEDAFSQWQLKHMLTRSPNRFTTPQDLERYQDEFVHIGQRTLTIPDAKFTATLQFPTLAQYQESGYDWVQGIINDVKASLKDMSTKQMEATINSRYLLSAMRQYAHWVKSLNYPNNVTVTDPEAISKSLELISPKKEITDAFIKGVTEYIGDSTAVVVAIPKYDCPACHAPASQDTTVHPFLIPLDAVHTFFTLRDQKIRTTLHANMDH